MGSSLSKTLEHIPPVTKGDKKQGVRKSRKWHDKADKLVDKKGADLAGEGQALSPKPLMRILLLGKSGSGKSALGNSILGRKQFQIAKRKEKHMTKEGASGTAETGSWQVCVIDTPDLLNPQLSEEAKRQTIVSFSELGVHAFLLVIPIGDDVANEQEVLKFIREMFGEDAPAYTMVLFTHSDDLDDGQSIEDYIQDQGEELKRLVSDCGSRTHVLDNKNSHIIDRQVSDLLSKIDAMMKKNGGKLCMLRTKIDSKEGKRNHFSEESAAGVPGVRDQPHGKATLAKQTVKSQIEGEPKTEEGSTGGGGLIDILLSGSNEGAGGGGDGGIGGLFSAAENEHGGGGGGGEAGGDAGGSADLRIVLLGKTGAGKSSTGNTILGETLFPKSCYAASDTIICAAKTKTVNGRKITVIDTPGYCCTERPDEDLKPDIVQCIIECAPGPHAFLILLAVGRHAADEKKVLEDILKMFGEDALKYAVVLFTHGDQLDENMTIQLFVEKNDDLKTLLQKCGNRLHVIDNKYWNNPIADCSDETRNSKQIKSLLNTIDQFVEQNGGKYYTNEFIQNVENELEEERDNIREETGGPLAENTVKERAKKKVFERFLIKSAGVSTGALYGSLYGPVALVDEVLIFWKDASVTKKGLVAVAAVGAVAVTPFAAIGGAIKGGITGAKAANNAENARAAAQSTIEAIPKALKMRETSH